MTPNVESGLGKKSTRALLLAVAGISQISASPQEVPPSGQSDTPVVTTSFDAETKESLDFNFMAAISLKAAEYVKFIDAVTQLENEFKTMSSDSAEGDLRNLQKRIRAQKASPLLNEGWTEFCKTAADTNQLTKNSLSIDPNNVAVINFCIEKLSEDIPKIAGNLETMDKKLEGYVQMAEAKRKARAEARHATQVPAPTYNVAPTPEVTVTYAPDPAPIVEAPTVTDPVTTQDFYENPPSELEPQDVLILDNPIEEPVVKNPRSERSVPAVGTYTPPNRNSRLSVPAPAQSAAVVTTPPAPVETTASTNVLDSQPVNIVNETVTLEMETAVPAPEVETQDARAEMVELFGGQKLSMTTDPSLRGYNDVYRLDGRALGDDPLEANKTLQRVYQEASLDSVIFKVEGGQIRCATISNPPKACGGFDVNWGGSSDLNKAQEALLVAGGFEEGEIYFVKKEAITSVFQAVQDA